MENEKPQIVNTLDEKKKKSMKNRILVGVGLAAVAVPALIVGSWFWFALITAFAGFAIYEIIHAKGKKFHWTVWAFTYFICAIYIFWFLAKNNISEFVYLKDAGRESEWTFELERWYAEPAMSIYALIGALAVYIIMALANKDFDFSDVCYFFAMTFLVGLGFQCMLFLRYHPFFISYGLTAAEPPGVFRFWGSAVLFIFVIIGTFGSDTMAYFTGVFFGKHKMTPRISPNKTWEGFIGGWILGGGLAFGFALICDACGFPLIRGMEIFSEHSMWWGVAIVSFSLPIVGVIGDLCFSMIKRFFGFKDFGKLLGAHGGVLDRADSLIFCSILTSVLIVILENGWRFFV